MNPDFKPPDELVDLLVAAVDGEQDGDGRARLNQLAAGDADVREYYVQYMTTHAMLNWRHGQASALDVPMALADEPIPRPRNILSWLVSLTVAASLVIGVGWFVWQEVTHVEPLATVTESDEVDGPQEPLRIGETMRPGEYHLESGMRRIRLTSGVVIAMQGPVRIALPDVGHAKLDHGSIRVYVPTNARGFIVDAANVEILDLGTDFGVWVNTIDEVEVHVFEGKVRLNKSVDVSANEALRVGAGKGTRKVSNVKLNSGMFPAVKP